LNEWPVLFTGVKIIQNRGANVAPWNVMNYEIIKTNGQILVDGYPLVFFHFHGFKRINEWLYNTNLGLTFRIPSNVLKSEVFRPYILALNQLTNDSGVTKSIRRKHLRNSLLQAIRPAVRTLIGIAFRQYVFLIGEKVY
jgi:hypothetical protein